MLQGLKTFPETLCDTVMYNKKYMLFDLFIAQSSSNSWNFLRGENDKSVSCYVNEVILEKQPLDGAGFQGIQPWNHVIRGLEIAILTPQYPTYWKGRRVGV